jgi:putative spermidine/putrescine transport system substrate-binding protein
MKRVQSGLILTSALVISVLAAGCGGSSSSGSSSTTASTVASQTVPATKPSRLVVRFAGSEYGEVMKKTVVARFEKETSIPVTVDNTEEYTAFAKNDQALQSGQRPPDDCQINNQPYAYLDAIHGYSLPISPKVAPNLEQVEQGVAAPTGLALNNDGSWPYVGIYQLSVPFVENEKVIPADAVTSWKDLAKPILHKAVEIDGAYQSSAFGIAKALGVTPTTDPASMAPVWKYLHELRSSEAVNGTSIDAVRALVSGQIKLAITPPLDGVTAKKQGVHIRFVVPKEGMIIVTDSFYINKNIPANSYYYCEKFANIMLDPTVQAEWASDLGLVPTDGHAAVPAFMADNPKVFPRTEAQINAVSGFRAPVPLEARNQATWQSEFENATK